MNDTNTLSLQAVVSDLLDEGDELYSLLRDIDTSIWTQHTTFKNWSVWDVVAHLHLSDHMALSSISSAEKFHRLLAQLRAGNFTAQWLSTNGHSLTGPQLLERWHETFIELCAALNKADPAQRFVWVGPGMKARMLATARQMETWAHGWEVYDLIGKQRIHSARLKNIATIGVKTFGWTFSNRKLPVPDIVPYVSLTAPGGEQWQWNDANSAHRIEGDAVAFCQVVTQVRNIADTSLRVEGDNATAWMQIAQCFAGPPQEPPAAGIRFKLNPQEKK